ncbi:hypothetical protein AYI69_g643 [Smittium culicis]|uniref:Uncharacterized protein n=1 Tax=Smittium culicis TaxID=133412 RepID=A0A1R1YSF0_9FUNG|nr:hypothetical protein AYI69_g643 [Smittium culicis]
MITVDSDTGSLYDSGNDAFRSPLEKVYCTISRETFPPVFRNSKRTRPLEMNFAFRFSVVESIGTDGVKVLFAVLIDGGSLTLKNFSVYS